MALGSDGRGGWVVPVIDRTTLTFGTAGTTDLELAQVVPTEGWVSGALMVPVHSTATFGGTLTIYVVQSFVAFDDPATLFAPATPTATYIARAAITSATPQAGQLSVAAFTGAIGPRVRVFAEYV